MSGDAMTDLGRIMMVSIDRRTGAAVPEIRILENGEVKRGGLAAAHAFLDRLAADYPELTREAPHVP